MDSVGVLTLYLELDLEEEAVVDGSHVHGNEHWEFDDARYMRRREASINDYNIDEPERRYRGEG